MTRTDIAALALRIAALYLCVSAFFQALSAVSIIVQLPQFDDAQSFIAAYAIDAALLAIAGIVLFVAAPTLARRTTSGEAQLQLHDHAAIGAIALRVAGVVAWDAALRQLPAVSLTDPTAPWMYFSVQVGVVVLFAGVGTWLFARAPVLAERWFDSSRRTSATSASILPMLAFAAVGMFVLLDALPMFLMSVVTIARDTDSYATGLTANWRELISSLLRLVLSGALILGSGGVARLWERLSTAGLNRPGNVA